VLKQNKQKSRQRQMLKGSGHGAIAEKWADSAGFCWIPGPLRLWGWVPPVQAHKKLAYNGVWLQGRNENISGPQSQPDTLNPPHVSRAFLLTFLYPVVLWGFFFLGTF